MNGIPNLLQALDQGDPGAADRLLPLVYEELRRLAKLLLTREAPGQTLQPTALVHEAYLRLISPEGRNQWDNTGHFFAAAAEAMRRILIDRARSKQALRHGGGRRRIPLDACHRFEEFKDDVLVIDDALTRFAAEEPEKAQLVKLRFFAGLTTPEAAAALGISLATAERWWAYARAWLFSELQGDDEFSASD
ncbi:MAG: sigma-70 family RNA polymerase sigma factor [Gemmataceae bacterium]